MLWTRQVALVSNYEFGQKIGQGGMADVFLGFQHSLGGFRKLVVLKQILPTFSQDKLFVSLFMEEARLAAAIRHPNVVETYDIRVETNRLFIAMEYIDGLTIADILQDLPGTSVPPRIAAHIAADIAGGLHAAHTTVNRDGVIEPIVHLDVTPSNLMLDTNGNTKVLDYGIAIAANNDRADECLRGKPGYLPPEYATGGKVSPRGDVFQLGLVLQDMLSGHRQRVAAASGRQGTDVAAKAATPPPANWSEGIPTALEQIVLAATSPDVEKRQETAQALQFELLAFLRSEGNPRSEEVAEWLIKNFSQKLARKKKIEQAMRTKSGERAEESPKKTSQGALLTDPTEDLSESKEGHGGRSTVNLRRGPSTPVPSRRPIGRRVVGLAAIATLGMALALFFVLRSSTERAPISVGEATPGNPMTSSSPQESPKETKPKVETPSVAAAGDDLVNTTTAPANERSAAPAGEREPTAANTSRPDSIDEDRSASRNSPSKELVARPRATTKAPAKTRSSDLRDPWAE